MTRGGTSGRGPVSDAGSGSVLVLAIVGVVLLVGLVLTGVGTAVTARAAAQSAADLAALAAGDVLALALVLGGESGEPGESAACDRADEVARQNGGTLESCTHEGHGVVVVQVARQSSVGPARAAARAGPGGSR